MKPANFHQPNRVDATAFSFRLNVQQRGRKGIGDLVQINSRIGADFRLAVSSRGIVGLSFPCPDLYVPSPKPTMPAVGYVLTHCVPDSGSDDRALTGEILQSFCKDRNLDLQAIFLDTIQSAHLPWLRRPAGLLLAEQLQPGDQVIVQDVGAIYTTAPDLLSALHDFRARNITLHFVRFKLFSKGPELSLSTAGQTGAATVTALMVLSSLSKSTRSEVVSQGMRKRKREGKKYCHYAGYGFQWRRGQRVPNSDEQTVIAKIVEWREKIGCSWNEIASHLLRCGVTVAATGAEWSPSRVRRAYLAALRNSSAFERD